MVAPFLCYDRKPVLPTNLRTDRFFTCSEDANSILNSLNRRTRSLRTFFVQILSVQLQTHFEPLQQNFFARNIIYMSPTFIQASFPSGTLNADFTSLQDQLNWKNKLLTCQTSYVTKSTKFKNAFHFIRLNEYGIPSSRVKIACEFFLKRIVVVVNSMGELNFD